MKTDIATYYCPGYKARGYHCQPGETKGTLNLLNAEGRVVVQGVPVYNGGEEIEPPNGYCTPGLAEGARPPREAKGNEAKAPAPKREKEKEKTLSETKDKADGEEYVPAGI
jgi:hypothetical protein